MGKSSLPFCQGRRIDHTMSYYNPLALYLSQDGFKNLFEEFWLKYIMTGERARERGKKENNSGTSGLYLCAVNSFAVGVGR